MIVHYDCREDGRCCRRSERTRCPRAPLSRPCCRRYEQAWDSKKKKTKMKVMSLRSCLVDSADVEVARDQPREQLLHHLLLLHCLGLGLGRRDDVGNHAGYGGGAVSVYGGASLTLADSVLASSEGWGGRL